MQGNSELINVVVVPGGIMPKYASSGASGFDLHARLDAVEYIYPGETRKIPVGIKISIPKGLELQIRPRSGMAIGKEVTVINTPGTIDSDYRGEIVVGLHNLSRDRRAIHPGDRIAQAVLCPVLRAEFIQVDNLDKTVRGENGFGSTGVKANDVWYKHTDHED